MADQIPYETSAALSTLMYDLAGKDIQKGATLESVLDNPSYSFSNKELFGQVIEANGLEDVKILDTSWSHVNRDGTKTYGTMNAVTFQVGDDIYIAYRGTGNNNWKYNADSAYGDSPSTMQNWSLEYFNESVERYTPGTDGLYVTGHSQGGNNAMYVTIASEYAAQINSCVSVDGPGFSEDVIRDISAQRGADFMASQTDKIYAIYGNNDYVHRLGEVHITPSGHEFTVDCPTAKDFGGYHSIETHLVDGKINLKYDENGNPVSVPDGPASELIAKLNENMLKYLPEEDRYEAGKAAMAIAELLIGNGELSNLSDVEGLRDLIDTGLPLLLVTAVQNPDDLTELVFGEDSAIAEWVKAYPVLATLLLATLSIVLLDVGNFMEKLLSFADFIQDVIQTVALTAQTVITFVTETIDAIITTIENAMAYLRSVSPGGKYAASNPHFRADPDLLRHYARRLGEVNRRLVQLDIDLNDLYLQVGLLDVLSILESNILTSYSINVKSAETFLYSAADILEAADQKALGCIGG